MLDKHRLYGSVWICIHKIGALHQWVKGVLHITMIISHSVLLRQWCGMEGERNTEMWTETWESELLQQGERDTLALLVYRYISEVLIDWVNGFYIDIKWCRNTGGLYCLYQLLINNDMMRSCQSFFRWNISYKCGEKPGSNLHRQFQPLGPIVL